MFIVHCSLFRGGSTDGASPINSLKLEATIYLLDENLGHHIPLFFWMLLHFEVALRERRLPYFALELPCMKRLWVAFVVVFGTVGGAFYAFYCDNGGTYILFYPLATAVVFALVVLRFIVSKG